MSLNADQVPPLIDLLKHLPVWCDLATIKHIGAAIGAGSLAHFAEYWMMRRDVSYIKGVVDELARDHAQREANTLELQRLNARFDIFEERAAQMRTRPKPSHF